MPAHLLIIWDYDSAIGQINATYPYNYGESAIREEIRNVDLLLEAGRDYRLQMTFACLGFAAEPGQYPFHVPEQIAKIGALGHEVASHSWRHEWFPYLERQQLAKTLERSKSVLEACLGEPGAVKGFVPPFNRPMSWYSRGALSLGDRAFGPWYPGASLGSVLRFAADKGYRWCRVAYRPMWKKFLSAVHPKRDRPEVRSSKWPSSRGVTCVPMHYCGFDEPAQELLTSAVQQNGTVIIGGHPSGLGRKHGENIKHVKGFLKAAAELQERGLLRTQSVSGYLDPLTKTAPK